MFVCFVWFALNRNGTSGVVSNWLSSLRYDLVRFERSGAERNETTRTKTNWAERSCFVPSGAERSGTNQPNSTYTNSSNFMFSYFSVNCVFNIIEYFSYLNLWLVILFLFIMAFFLVLGSTQLINSSRLCSDVVFETSLVLFSFVLIAIIISPALIILLDLELIIMPSFIIYSCGVQWLWSFSLTYLNWISNCDHYVYSSYLVSSRACSSWIELVRTELAQFGAERSGTSGAVSNETERAELFRSERSGTSSINSKRNERSGSNRYEPKPTKPARYRLYWTEPARYSLINYLIQTATIRFATATNFNDIDYVVFQGFIASIIISFNFGLKWFLPSYLLFGVYTSAKNIFFMCFFNIIDYLALSCDRFELVRYELSGAFRTVVDLFGTRRAELFRTERNELSGVVSYRAERTERSGTNWAELFRTERIE